MFVTEKLRPDGSHDKIKARFVGGGHQQDRNMIDNVSSPTIDITKLFTVLGIAAHEGRFVSVGDIPGAYLNASMNKPGLAPVYMTIGKDVVPLVLEIDPSYKDFVMPNGTVVVKLDKALYGLIESGKPWYEHLTGVLVKDGYKPPRALRIQQDLRGRSSDHSHLCRRPGHHKYQPSCGSCCSGPPHQAIRHYEVQPRPLPGVLRHATRL